MSVEVNLPESHALTGLRILDFTSRMGGYCGLLLANLGAEVILIEPPGGDAARREEPFKDDIPNPDGSLSFAPYQTRDKTSTTVTPSSLSRDTSDCEREAALAGAGERAKAFENCMRAKNRAPQR